MFLRFAVFALAFVAAGCVAVVQTAYNNADFFVVRNADDYLNLDSAQKRALSDRVNEVVAMHRNEELPDYLVFIEDVKTMVNDGLTDEETGQIMDRFENLYRQAVVMAVPVATDTLASLSADQIDFLEEKFEDENEDYREELDADAEERLEKRARETIDSIESWTGRLSREQRALVMRLSKALPDNDEAWYQYGLNQQDKLVSLLRANSDSDRLEPFLRDWWLGENAESRDVVDSVDHMRPLVRDLVLQIDARLTADQRERIVRRLDRYYRAFAGLLETETPLVDASTIGSPRT